MLSIVNEIIRLGGSVTNSHSGLFKSFLLVPRYKHPTGEISTPAFVGRTVSGKKVVHFATERLFETIGTEIELNEEPISTGIIPIPVKIVGGRMSAKDFISVPLSSTREDNLMLMSLWLPKGAYVSKEVGLHDVRTRMLRIESNEKGTSIHAVCSFEDGGRLVVGFTDPNEGKHIFVYSKDSLIGTRKGVSDEEMQKIMSNASLIDSLL